MPVSSPEAYAKARQLVDAAHNADPSGQELGYADGVEASLLKWVKELVPHADEILLLAARCQHLERFATPRSSYPEGKAGYLKWRRDLYTIQANRAKELLLEAGVLSEEAESVYRWVSKDQLLRNPEEGTQALEDGAVLVFLSEQLGSFAAQHDEYAREKLVDILRKTWRKLSPKGKEAARGLELPDGLREIVEEATSA